jgi:hypothetical protein
MPWLETCAVESRLNFVQDAQSGDWGVALRPPSLPREGLGEGATV